MQDRAEQNKAEQADWLQNFKKWSSHLQYVKMVFLFDWELTHKCAELAICSEGVCVDDHTSRAWSHAGRHTAPLRLLVDLEAHCLRIHPHTYVSRGAQRTHCVVDSAVQEYVGC